MAFASGGGPIRSQSLLCRFDLQILQQLEAYRAYPDFNNYLTFLFAKGEQLAVEVCSSMPGSSMAGGESGRPLQAGVAH